MLLFFLFLYFLIFIRCILFLLRLGFYFFYCLFLLYLCWLLLLLLLILHFLIIFIFFLFFLFGNLLDLCDLILLYILVFGLRQNFLFQHDLFLNIFDHLLMLFRLLMISQLVLAFKSFLTNFTIKLCILKVIDFLMILVIMMIQLSLLLVIFLYLFEPFFLQLLLYNFHRLFLFLLFTLFLKFLLLLSLFFLFDFNHILSEARISLFYVGHQIFNGLQEIFLLSLSLLFVLLLHLSFNPSVVSISCIPFFNPYECLVGSKILPIVIKFQNFLLRSCKITESLKFSLLFLFKIFSRIKSFSFLRFNSFKDIPINSEEPFLIIFITIETVHGKILPYIESEAVLFQILFAELILIEKYLLAVVIIPSSFVSIIKHIVCLVYLYKFLFCILL